MKCKLLLVVLFINLLINNQLAWGQVTKQEAATAMEEAEILRYYVIDDWEYGYGEHRTKIKYMTYKYDVVIKKVVELKKNGKIKKGSDDEKYISGKFKTHKDAAFQLLPEMGPGATEFKEASDEYMFLSRVKFIVGNWAKAKEYADKSYDEAYDMVPILEDYFWPNIDAATQPLLDIEFRLFKIENP